MKNSDENPGTNFNVGVSNVFLCARMSIASGFIALEEIAWFVISSYLVVR